MPPENRAYVVAAGEAPLTSTPRGGIRASGSDANIEPTGTHERLLECARRTPEQTAAIRDANIDRLHANYQLWKDQALFDAMAAKQIEKDIILAKQFNLAYAPTKDAPSASDLHTTLMRDHQAAKDASAARRQANKDLKRAIKLSKCFVE